MTRFQFYMLSFVHSHRSFEYQSKIIEFSIVKPLSMHIPLYTTLQSRQMQINWTNLQHESIWISDVQHTHTHNTRCSWWILWGENWMRCMHMSEKQTKSFRSYFTMWPISNHCWVFTHTHTRNTLILHLHRPNTEQKHKRISVKNKRPK